MVRTSNWCAFVLRGVTGIFEIVATISLRRAITNEWALVLAGIASIIFALLLFLFPGSGALAVVTIIGIYAIMFGILLITWASGCTAFRTEPGA